MSTDPAVSRRAALPSAVIEDQWIELRRHTAARIALGRSGASLPTRAVLEFGAAHALARDAVLTPLDIEALTIALAAEGFAFITVRSRAPDRAAYLARPDWGRRLDAESATQLGARTGAAPDVVITIGDGLSSTAVQRHAAPLAGLLRRALPELEFAPLVVAVGARVALADEIGERFGAGIAVCLIGERPGLSAADSLGAYLTFAPRVGRHDAERNCVSNIRPQGLSLQQAAAEIAALVQDMRAQRISGVGLKRLDEALPPATA